MKATELRIGNYLDRNGLMEVKAIFPLRIKVYDHVNKTLIQYRFFISTFNPIPLTEEWLLKFGFKRTNEGAGFTAYYYWIDLFNNDKLFLRGYYMGGYLWGFNEGFFELGQPIAIEYVHQIQNLYFALTGEELTLKP